MPPQVEPSQKQQVTELLKNASNVVITTGKNPSVDCYAAVIALFQMLEKMGKRSEAVISSSVPGSLNFLPTNLISNKFIGLRDFVIELDISKTEADKLKYIPEGKRLKIYITPYNGNFSKQDLGFSYGDYHCDGIIALGVSNIQELDNALASQKQLLEKTKLVLVNAGAANPPAGGQAPANGLAWNEPTATSLSEMLMSLSEALQPGILDNHIATSLLTGIMDSTNHFTASNTTPKVMTMAAQLMAAGASQAEIVKNLQISGGGKVQPQKDAKPSTPSTSAQKQPQDLKANGETSLPHEQPRKPEPKQQPVDQPYHPGADSAVAGPGASTNNYTSSKPNAAPVVTPGSTQFSPPPFAPPGMPAMPFPPPPLPGAVPPPLSARSSAISQVRSETDGNPFATVAGSPLNTPNPAATSPVVNSSPSQGGLVGAEHKPIDLDAARRAVEEASRNTSVPPPPPMPPASPPPSQ